ncbi:hypothetical protein GCM10011501_30080 [Thalassotalea profundi]|uniref:Uncharacterized protein n=1 Tax=Thalassotalea profundi TaxID=2036687 RepID=A0ABQ3IYF8_9GAMM|nr:hypothetical protein GCM10011501_30080 [Thalassotalea profundi]
MELVYNLFIKYYMARSLILNHKGEKLDDGLIVLPKHLIFKLSECKESYQEINTENCDLF